jgi:predicted phosphodiesterase
MRYLILSDLHSNWEALQAALADARGLYDQILCLGDLAGYGPDPNQVIEWVRENVTVCIRGNHDRASCGLEDLEWFNPVAKAATIWTMERLTAENRSFLEGLPRGPVAVNGFLLAHGSPLDEDEYLVSITDARNVFSYLESNIVFFGHTHLQGVFSWLNGCYDIIRRPEPFETEVQIRLEPDGAYLINPGSIGQPRDTDARAAWAIFDNESLLLKLRRTPYDSDATRRKIQAAGLPEILGTRLTIGR